MAVNEMEAAATQQLQGLANKSEMAINSIRTKLDKANDRIEEFQALIKVRGNYRTALAISAWPVCSSLLTPPPAG
jgi:hypothetical protein